MRLRKKPGAEEMLRENEAFVVSEPTEWRGRWNERFGNDHPIHVEIGTGKGQFILEMAKRHPEINFVGVELQTSVLFVVLEKQLVEKLRNLQLVQFDALEISDVFENGEVAEVYLNFSDPWPKNRHEKRRLTHPQFLKNYERILAPTGDLRMKTDNRSLFEYSLVSFSQTNWTLQEVSLDLHADEDDENIRTEYEEKFSKRGHLIRLGVFAPPSRS